MKLHLLGAVCAYIFTTLITSTVYAGTFSFTDGIFNSADWTNLTLVDTAGGGNTVVGEGQDLTGGNPDEFFHGDITWNAAGTVYEAHMYVPGTYDPSIDGTINTIDLEIDGKVLSSVAANILGLGVILQQGSSYYVTLTQTIAESEGWAHRSVTGLTESDFTLLTGAGTLDFSSAGGVISVGYFSAGGVVSAASQEWGVDNFDLTISSTPILPPVNTAPLASLPALIVMFVGLFGSGLIVLSGVAKRK